MKNLIIGFCLGVFVFTALHEINDKVQYNRWVAGFGTRCSDPNYYDYSEPQNAVILIDGAYMRVLEGSSVRQIDIGDPNIAVAYIDMPRGNMAIEITDPNASGILIKNCHFYMAGTY